MTHPIRQLPEMEPVEDSTGVPAHIDLLSRFKQSVSNTAAKLEAAPTIDRDALHALAELYVDLSDLDRYARISAGMEPRPRYPQWVTKWRR